MVAQQLRLREGGTYGGHGAMGTDGAMGSYGGEGVEATFTDSHYLWGGGKCPQQTQTFRGHFREVPRVDTHRVQVARTENRTRQVSQIDRVDVDNRVALQGVGMEISNHGTGS